jgi:hypothetical protein
VFNSIIWLKGSIPNKHGFSFVANQTKIPGQWVTDRGWLGCEEMGEAKTSHTQIRAD